MRDVAAVIAAMDRGDTYSGLVETGVINHRDPAMGLLCSVLIADSTVWLLTVDDRRGGQALVRLDRAGSEALQMASAFMVAQL
jgi:hypothetical protein